MITPKTEKPKILVITGPTATGKSDLAVYLAKRFNGEIISADSRQVYKCLDIGTGKITEEEMEGVPHHLLDVVNPKKQFSADDFKKLAGKTMAEILARNRLPIVCGGTGFYVRVILEEIDIPNVAPNKELRAEFEKKSTAELFEILKKLDKKRSSEIDSKNRVRLIRAIEIAKALGSVPRLTGNRSPYDTLKIGLNLPQEILKEKIHNRLIKRMNHGMLDEAENLHSRGLSYKRMERLGLEYRYLARLLQDKITAEEMFTQLETEICRYAKRQMTFFKTDRKINWFEPAKMDKIENLVKDFLEEIS